MKNKYEKSDKISEGKFREILKAFSWDVSALTASKLYGLNYRTAHRLYTLLRQRLVQLALEELRPFAGEIEVDESYFGARRVRGKRRRGASGKTPVLELHKRGDRVFVNVRENCSKREFMRILKGAHPGKERRLHRRMESP